MEENKADGLSQNSKDLNLSMSYYDCLGAITVAVEKCKLCGLPRRPFTCATCVNQGHFSRSNCDAKTVSENYSDKCKRWRLLKADKELLVKRIEKLLAGKISKNNKEFLCREKQRQNNLYGQAIASAENGMKEDKAKETDVDALNCYKESKIAKLQAKITKCKDALEQRRTLKKHGGNEDIQNLQSKIQQERQNHVRELSNLIFPIEEIEPRSSAGSDDEALDTVSALAEARNTAYIRGRWVYTANGSELHYRVIAPLLPGNGDYSAYSDSMSVIQDSSSMDLGEKNSTHTLIAGLGLTAQLSNILAYFLDASLPSALCYSTFAKHLSDAQFARSAWRLNHNVLELCCMQQVQAMQLHPRQMVHNLLLLLRNQQSLGITGPYDVEPELMYSMEASYPTRNDDDSSDDDVATDPDWEQIPVCCVSEIEQLPPPAEIPPVPQESQISTAGSLAGGLFNSVASLWR